MSTCFEMHSARASTAGSGTSVLRSTNSFPSHVSMRFSTACVSTHQSGEGSNNGTVYELRP